MLSVEQIRAGLAVARLKDVAERTGINYQTITRFARGEIQAPAYATVKALSDYLLSDEYLLEVTNRLAEIRMMRIAAEEMLESLKDVGVE